MGIECCKLQCKHVLSKQTHRTEPELPESWLPVAHSNHHKKPVVKPGLPAAPTYCREGLLASDSHMW